MNTTKATQEKEPLFSKLKRKLKRREKPNSSPKSNGRTKKMDNAPKDNKNVDSASSQTSTSESDDSQRKASKSTSVTESKASHNISEDSSLSTHSQALSQTETAPKINQAQARSQIGATTRTSQAQAQVHSDVASKAVSDAIIKEVSESDTSLARENVDSDKQVILTTVTDLTKSVVTTPGSLSLWPSKEIGTTKPEAKAHVEERTDSTDFSTGGVREKTSKNTTEEVQDIESIHGPIAAEWHIDLKPKNPMKNPKLKGERYIIRVHHKEQTRPVTLPGVIPSQRGGGSSRPPTTIKPRKRGHV